MNKKDKIQIKVMAMNMHMEEIIEFLNELLAENENLKKQIKELQKQNNHN
ncbi:hypothetical protein SAMN02745164_00522 [Marinitoga hydrogenitolerans DSM 16785]|uniref:Uncharacterized protein n=1 Tax=Marinitoga hydrogenitolerans (strain DSM 16785 / JCM 12826 / AT1271) TaxID=1122195 RepID=A0A1M4TVC3_MARH1|nr:hypothetical protein [Marinitoga hydrogenitolerans]SHE48422.1 hypothetical protein SAMN02745164_00522 [Marinitoga hydrogenitolerans DSM 16785]